MQSLTAPTLSYNLFTVDLPSRRRFLLRTAALILSAAPLASLAADTTYKVRKGDTLSGIARKHGTTITAVKRANGLKSDRILAGQTLRIPVNQTTSLTSVDSITKGITLKQNHWQYIVAHHSAIEAGNAEIYDRNHRRRGMKNGLAYHFVIGNGRDSGDGEIEIGPRWSNQLAGGHVRSQAVNEVGIGICMVGNFEERRPSTKQVAALEGLIDYLGNDLLNGKFKFTVHKEVDKNHTVCPGRYFPLKTMHGKFG